MTYVAGTLAHTYIDNAGVPIASGATGDSITFNVRTLVDAARFPVASTTTGAYFWIWWDNEILKVTAGGAGFLSWTAIRGQCGTSAIAHADGTPIRETVPGPALNGFVQSAAPIWNHLTKTVSYALTISDPPLIIVNAASLTITLPSAVLAAERFYRVKNTNLATSTIVAAAAGNIDNAATDTSLSTALAIGRYYSDGANYWKV